MSAQANLVFYGLRFPIEAGEIEAYELRRHPLIGRAKAVGLDFYWANFGGIVDQYFAFVGKNMALTGEEYESEVVLDSEALEMQVAEVRAKIAKAEFQGKPMLYVQWLPSP
jgi:hypothetical protein